MPKTFGQESLCKFSLPKTISQESICQCSLPKTFGKKFWCQCPLPNFFGPYKPPPLLLPLKREPTPLFLLPLKIDPSPAIFFNPTGQSPTGLFLSAPLFLIILFLTCAPLCQRSMMWRKSKNKDNIQPLHLPYILHNTHTLMKWKRNPSLRDLYKN